MKWKPKQLLLVAAMFFAAATFGQQGDFLFKRKLENVSDKWHKIPIPDDVFSKINPDFSDLRVLGITPKKDTIEIPYLLNNPAKQEVLKEIPFRLINESEIGSSFYFTFDANSNEAINEIDLNFKETNFDWKIKLEGSQNLQEWFSIVDDYRILSIKNSLTNFQFTKLVFPESKYRYFRIFLKNSKKPVLKSARLIRKKLAEGTIKTYPVITQKIEEDKKQKQTVITLSLQEKVPVASLKITVNAGIDYYRPVTISFLADSSKSGNEWRYFYETLTSGILESTAPNSLAFESTIAKDLKIIIENSDNQPLKIDSVKVMGYQYYLTARFTEPADYFLFYGNKSASKPDYDIARFVENVPEKITTITPGKEEVLQNDAGKKTSLFENKNWMWLIMGIIIMTLGWFSIRMIKKKA